MTDSHRSQAVSGGILLAVVGLGVTALWLRFNVEPGAQARPFPHDLVYYFLPQLDQVGERLASGELPMWNPDPCTGLPLLASLQVAVFYPVTWLAAVLPADRVLSISVFLHMLLGGVSSALVFQTWGVASSLAGAFGVVFAVAGLVGQSFWPPEVATSAWLPFLLFCTERVMAAERPDRWWLALVAGTALHLFAGFPQFVVYGLQLLVPFAILRGVQRMLSEDRRRPSMMAGLRVAAALILGAGIAMVQLVPTFEVLSSSHRSQRFTEEEVHYLQREARLGTLLENAVDPAPRLTTYELGKGAGYLGIGTLVLAGVGLVGRRRDPLVWCLAGAGGFWLVLSDGYLGVGSEIYRLYAMLPGIGLLRAPERLLFPAFGCWIALAALGADAADRAGGEPRSRRIALGVTAVGVAGAVGFLGAPGAGWRSVLAVGWVAGALLLPNAPTLRHLWRGGAALLLVADVLAATAPSGSLRDVPSEWAERMRAGRHELISSEDLAAVRERAEYARVEFFAPGMQVRPLMGVGAAGGVHRLACYETLLPGQWPALSTRAGGRDYRSAVMSNLDPARIPAIYDAASVVTVVRAVPGRRVGKALARVEIRDNADALPRAYLVDRFEVVTDEVALDRLVKGDFDPRRSVLLDADPGLMSSPAIGAAIPAEIVRFTPERVEIAVQSPGEAMLVLTDTDAPGWHATTDAAPTPIYRANGLFRAVRVPPGDHLVVFEYAPTSLRLGAGVSFFCAFVACAVLGVTLRRSGACGRPRQVWRASRRQPSRDVRPG